LQSSPCYYNNLSNDGTFTFNATATDALGKTNTTQTRLVTVDNTPASVVLEAPSHANGANITDANSNLTINVSAVDATLGLHNITLYLDGAILLSCTSSPCYYNNETEDGVYVFNATSFDVNGNKNSTALRTVTFDSAAPQVAINFPTGGQNISGNFRFNATVTDATTAVHTVLFNITQGAAQQLLLVGVLQGNEYVNLTDTSALSDGLYNVTVIANDTLNNINKSVSVQFRIDNIVPSAVLESPSKLNLANFTGNLTINVSSTDGAGVGLLNISIMVNSVITKTCTSSPCYYNVLRTDGAYTFNATAYDGTGAFNTTETRSVTVDNTVPAIAYQAPTHASQSNSTGNLTVNVSASDATVGLVNISIFVDGSNVLTCTSSPCYYNNLSNDGTHVFNATAFDALNQKNATLTRTVTIDNTNPTIQFENPTPSNNVNLSANLTINVSATDATVGLHNISILVNGVIALTCSNPSISPCYYNALIADGPKNVTANAFDVLGNTITTAQRNFTVDNTPPVVAINFPTGGQNVSAMFRFNATVTDALLGIENVLFNITQGATQQLLLVAILQGNEYVNLTDTSALPDGLYNVTVIANDTLNNINNTVTKEFRIDNNPPAVLLENPTLANLVNVTGNLTINVSDGDGSGSGLLNISIMVNSAIVMSCSTSPCFYNVLRTDGNYVFNATAYDATGQSNTTETRNVTIDNTDPVINFQNPSHASPSNSTGNLTVNVSASDATSGLVNISIFVDGSNVLTCTSSPCYYNNESNDGTHVFNATAFDVVAQSNSTLTRTVTIDNTPAAIDFQNPTHVNGANITNANSNLTINVSAVDATLGLHNITLYLDGAKLLSCTSSSCYYNNKTNNGVYVFNATSFDINGNKNSTVLRTVTFDSAAPQVAINFPTVGQNISGNFRFNATVTDATTAVHTVLFNITQGAAQQLLLVGVLQGNEYVNLTDTSALSDGLYNVTVIANDTLNNINNTETVEFDVDNTPPNLTIHTPVNNSFNNSNFFINVTTIEVHTVKFVMVNVTNTTGQTWLFFNLTNLSALSGTTLWNGSINIAGLPDGNYTVWFNATDNIDQSVIKSVIINIDTTAPVITVFTLSSETPLESSDVTSVCTATDNGEAFGGTVLTLVTGFLTDTLGDATATCTATDNTGNVNTSTVDYQVLRAGGGGGGGGASSTFTRQEIEANTPTTFNFDNFKLPVLGVILTLEDGDKTYTVVSITTKEVINLPESVPDLSSDYDYFEVLIQNFKDENVIEASIDFAVPRDWLELHGLDASDIALFRFVPGTGWVELETTVIDAAFDPVKLRGNTPGFSYFGIAKKTGAVMEVQEPVAEPSSNEVPVFGAPEEPVSAPVTAPAPGAEPIISAPPAPSGPSVFSEVLVKLSSSAFILVLGLIVIIILGIAIPLSIKKLSHDKEIKKYYHKLLREETEHKHHKHSKKQKK